MFDYAQTNLQLIRQMQGLTYSDTDIIRVERAYQAAIPMFSGLYRGSGKPFISHLVGTASILASRHYPVDMVLAGLMHAAYATGDFGFHPGRKGSQKQRQFLVDCIGERAEELVHLYERLSWKAQHIRSYAQGWHGLPAEQQTTICLRLANELEDFLDNGMITCGEKKADHVASSEVQASILSLAELADWPALASGLKNEFAHFNKARLDARQENTKGYSALRLPPAAKRRLLPRLEKALVRRLKINHSG